MRVDAPSRLARPLYSYAEADHLARVSRGTAKRWLAGYGYRGGAGERVEQPPVTPGMGSVDAVSFLDLVEVAAIGRLKDLGFSPRRIRAVVQYCQVALKEPRPLTTLTFKTDGREIFVEQGATLLEVGRRKGQQAWAEVLEPFLQTLDYTPEGLARRWWPLGHAAAIVVDPDYGFGLPVVAGSGVRTETIRERFDAGDALATIARDFNLDPAAVEGALRFESQRAA